MNQWYVKDLSRLTGVSKQTLHHYDEIDLLKPSLRLTNGYRLYSEADLLKLQQIVALKFFGFSLKDIQRILQGYVDSWDHFLKQADCLKERAKNLMVAAKTLRDIVAQKSSNTSIPWETILQLIEVYKMTQTLEKTWAGQVFDQEELKQYAAFEAGLKKRFTPEDKKNFDAWWHSTLKKVEENLQEDPKSSYGFSVAKEVMDRINNLYGKEYANLKQSIWEKGYKEGKMDGDHEKNPDVVAWLDKAIDAYYRERIYGLLDQVEVKVTKSVEDQWDALMDEMFGTSVPLKQGLVNFAQTDSCVGPVARIWLLSRY